MNFDAIVVGGGHAGCEATLALAKMGFKTLLVSGNLDKIAMMPCNPHIGGSAKGIVVREIDALGGMMGKVADKTLLQMKMLNFSKGPAVRSLRAQGDKVTYPKEMQRLLKEDKNITLIEDMVEDLIVENNKITGVILSTGEKISATSVILTTGTYMKADILVGNTRTRSGPTNTRPSLFLSENLEKLGFKILRLKTGTPPRIQRDTIDFSKTKMEPGDDKYYTFSFDDKPYYKIEEQMPCYLTYTTEKTHQIIRNNLSKSSMYGGIKEKLGTGPRYCPSIEDKIVRFADKERHQLFLEPESKYFDDIYVQGFSTSMPHDVQEEMVHSLPGLENAKILRYAYAIEYDAIDSKDLYPSLETKLIENLYTAGQINGTSGYEEAACQGLMAGINAGLKMQGKEPLVLKRDEAYIGVLIDDLVTKGVRDPYRLLTSRAEYRLLLRSDNADLRLRKYGYEVGLISKEQYDRLIEKEDNITRIINELNDISIKSEKKMNGIEFVKRTENNINDIKDKLSKEYDELELEQAEIQIKYEGYIKKARKEAEKMRKLENKKIPADIDYDKVPNLASEARIKLKEVRPLSFSQASRISGVNPSDIAILSVYMKRYFDEYK
ncbi:MAG: tRNA uridine-5-carboxymethylaminomethyl(34) synthesis enzyme MnmG [Bacilli bacterium]|nr:tRNA uridine-5-carboxymethylaminomethyl(34) synthesis enzyme MnmG [Bacilli bacterium]